MERVGEKNAHLLEMVARNILALGICEVRFRRPPQLTFVPGQFMEFVVGDITRDYTMVSAPQDPTLDFCIGIVPGGRFSETIQRAIIGSRFQLFGPSGHFIFHRAKNPAVFVATGTGVAPFVAFCRSGVKEALLLHGAGSPDRLVYGETLRSGVSRYVPCISRLSEKERETIDCHPGRVTDFLEKELPVGAYDFYLCGRRDMIRDATAIIDRRFDGSRLFVEPYD